MADSIFTQIIRGDLPAYKIYEDEKTLAFLDIHPVQPGHTLVVPKQQVEFIWDLDDDYYQALMASVKKVGRRIREVTKRSGTGLKVEGLGVPHAHVHILPFDTEEQFHEQPDLNAEPDHPALTAMAEKLRF